MKQHPLYKLSQQQCFDAIQTNQPTTIPDLHKKLRKSGACVGAVHNHVSNLMKEKKIRRVNGQRPYLYEIARDGK